MLSPDARTVLDAIAAAGAPRIETLSPEVAKREFLENAPRLQGDKEPVAEARDYAERLRVAGVAVTLDENPDQIHGFLSMDRFIRAARPAVGRAVAAWLHRGD